MSDDGRQQLARVTPQQLMQMPIDEALEAYSSNLIDALPAHIPVEHFRRMVLTAINQNLDLATADRRTLFIACVKCASDGLMPDGREAALVVFNTKTKNARGQEVWINAVQYMPMVAGIRKRMRNSGDVLSAEAEVVRKKDHFRFRLGDDPFIEHEPCGLETEDPGEVIGAYAIIKLRNGEIIRDVMRKADIEAARNISRAKDGPMWKNFYGEGARKTVLRRASKSAPQTAMIEFARLLDDEPPALPAPDEVGEVPPRPTRGDFRPRVIETQPEPGPTFYVVDLEGEEHEFDDPAKAETALGQLYDAAAKLGSKRLEGIAQDNSSLTEFFREISEKTRSERLENYYQDLMQRTLAREAEEEQKRIAAQSPPPPPPPPPPAAQQRRRTSEAAQGTQSAAQASPPPPASPPPAAGPSGELPLSDEKSATPTWFDSGNLEMEPRTRNGKRDFETWVKVQFMPRLREATHNWQVATLSGDNQRWLEEAGASSAALRQELEDAIADQYRKVVD